jgi:hypothetical protein
MIAGGVTIDALMAPIEMPEIFCASGGASRPWINQTMEGVI